MKKIKTIETLGIISEWLHYQKNMYIVLTLYSKLNKICEKYVLSEHFLYCIVSISIFNISTWRFMRWKIIKFHGVIMFCNKKATEVETFLWNIHCGNLWMRGILAWSFNLISPYYVPTAGSSGERNWVVATNSDFLLPISLHCFKL